MEITVGKYIPGNSIIHKLDPRVKLFANIFLIVLIFLVKNYIQYAILFAPIITAFFLSKMKFRKLFSMLKPVLFITIFLFLINIFTTEIPATGDPIPWFTPVRWKKIIINGMVLDKTFTISLRIYMMIIVTTLMTTTTKPVDLTRAIEDMMTPLKLIKFPVHIMAMIISIALRFIPTLLEESQRIMKAQASRGVDFKNGNIKSKVKSLITLIIPLFVCSFDKAFDLGNAMEVRGYDPYEKRTRYREYNFAWKDFFAITILSGLLITIVFSNTGILILPDLKHIRH